MCSNATSESCYLDSSFLITCNRTSSGVSTPYLSVTNINVLNISLDGEMRILADVARGCYDRNGTQNNATTVVWTINLSQYFSISSSRNKLTTVGCNTIGEFIGYDDPDGVNYTTGCLSTCLRINDTTNGVCNGAGCCRSPIPAQGPLSIFPLVVDWSVGNLSCEEAKKNRRIQVCSRKNKECGAP
ncbi:hypothetical protein PIB30_063353 [Stylosanthes scabra]|uniref:Wall-associated receptor kinase galacturonan-binding domain-containing protein n=1 Tax=Stylosanthes scabra TaxID=79078 RepID=A0ABU6ZK86_9FABA|nr:hypothetical protein [Stylosanthes scabra]